MRNQVSLRLSAVREEITFTLAALDRARHRLAGHRAALEDSRLRMLMAETALADRHLHLAAVEVDRISSDVGRLEGLLADLSSEEAELRSRLAGAAIGRA